MIRSLLFTPATRLAKLEKAIGSGADCVALDLEDGIGPDDKDAARAALTDFATTPFDSHGTRIAVRISALSTPDGVRDMAAMLAWPHWPAMLMLPKVNAAAEIAQLASLIAARGADTRIFAVIETAHGMANAASILSGHPLLAAAGYGSADHTAETGARMDWDGLAWARGQIINAAAAAGVPAVDGVYLDIRDPDGLAADSRRLRGLGFTGRIVIHPDQVAPVNAAFSPTETEIADARALVDAAAGQSGGAFAHNGRMIDAPVLAAAERILALASLNERND